MIAMPLQQQDDPRGLVWVGFAARRPLYLQGSSLAVWTEELGSFCQNARGVSSMRASFAALDKKIEKQPHAK
jgi:hypothetical protein